MGSAAMPSPSATTEIVWTNLPTSWGVFVFLSLVAGIVYAAAALYRRETAIPSPAARALLTALRLAVLLLLAGIFLGPSIVETQQREFEPAIVLLRDASQSMKTPDAAPEESSSAPGRLTRSELVNQLLSRNHQQLLEQLKKKGRVEVEDFAADVTTVKQAAGQPLPALDPTGRTTDLAGAIRQALGKNRPAAIVVFTDGQHTGPQRVEPLAREAAQQEVPLLLVGIGDPTRRDNLRVLSVYARPQTWQGERFEIEAVVAHDSAAARQVDIELREKKTSSGDGAADAGALLETKTISLPAGGGQQTIRFEPTAGPPGEYAYEVRVTSARGDDQASGSRLTSNIVKVLSRERLRVLLVAGSSTWDYRLVEKLLARDKTLQVSCWLQSLAAGRAQEGTLPITQLPATREELFAYDVVLLLDPDPHEFDAAWLDLLQAFVGEHAGGLFYMAGPKYTAQFLTSPRTSSLEKLLPVSFGDLQAGQIAALLRANTRAWPLEVVAANRDHPLLRFEADADVSRRLWNSLPGVFWSFPAQAARPTAEVLLAHSDPNLHGSRGPRPLLVTGRLGAGYTLYAGFSDTWRWRRAGQRAEFFDKFWIQTVRFLAEGRSLAGGRRGTLETDREHFELGEPVTLRARLVGPDYEPLVARHVPVQIAAPGQPPQELELMPLANQPGRFEATWTPQHTGIYQASIHLGELPSAAESIVIETSFRVELPSGEMNQVWMNRPFLRELASLSGGRYFDVEQVDELPAAVPDRTEIIVSRGPPRPLWDTFGMLTALVGLLCSEWFLRKRCKLL